MLLPSRCAVPISVVVCRRFWYWAHVYSSCPCVVPMAGAGRYVVGCGGGPYWYVGCGAGGAGGKVCCGAAGLGYGWYR